MGKRPVLEETNVATEALSAMAEFHSSVVEQVKTAVASEKFVVVGMAKNPFVKRARKALEKAGVEHKYLEYGGYLSDWKSRLAIKLWSGWPTFPQVFVGGKLIGGNAELQKQIASGKIA